MARRSSTDERSEWLAVYLNDHLAGSAAGIRRLERFARIRSGTPEGDELTRLAGEINDDRTTLLAVIDVVGASPSRAKQWAARVGELVARLKPNGRWWGGSPLTHLTESELILLAVRGKLAGWQVLAEVARPGEIPIDLAAQVVRSTRHYEQVADIHRRLAAEVLGT